MSKIKQVKQPISLGRSETPNHQLSNCLIIFSSSYDAPHFMNCIHEKLMCFLQPPYFVKNKRYSHQSEQTWYYPTRTDQFILKNLDEIDETELCSWNESKIRICLSKYDLLFFTLKSGTDAQAWKKSKILEIIREFVDRERLALSFAGSLVSSQLGYLKNVVGFGSGTTIDVKLIKNLKRRDALEQFLVDYPQSKSKLELEFDIKAYSSVVKSQSSEIDNDWLWIGKSQNDFYPLVLHKTRKIIYGPFYGLSHGNNCLHNLIFHSFKYLLFDHLKPNVDYSARLYLKCANNQLSDIDINC